MEKKERPTSADGRYLAENALRELSVHIDYLIFEVDRALRSLGVTGYPQADWPYQAHCLWSQLDLVQQLIPVEEMQTCGFDLEALVLYRARLRGLQKQARNMPVGSPFGPGAANARYEGIQCAYCSILNLIQEVLAEVRRAG